MAAGDFQNAAYFIKPFLKLVLGKMKPFAMMNLGY